MDAILNAKKYQIEEEEKHSSKFISALKSAYYAIYKVFANNKMLGHIKSTIALLLPILLIGYLSVVLLRAGFFPDLSDLLVNIYSLTLGIYTLYFTVVLTYKYMKDKITNFPVMLVILITNIVCVSLITNFSQDDSAVFDCSVKYIFIGIFYSYITVKVFSIFLDRKKTIYKVYTTEARKTAVLIGKLVLPFAIVVIPTALISFSLSLLGLNEFMDVFTKPFTFIFEHCHIDLINGVILSYFTSFFSFFGIGLQIDLTEVSSTSVFNANFVTLFVRIPLIFAFVFAVLIFGKRKKDKIYGSVAVAPTTLNAVNAVYYGFPMFLNPLCFIPCLIVPVITSIVSYYLVLAFGINVSADYQTSLSLILYNSYEATGNALAILVQFISIAISFLCFLPFVLLHNYARQKALKENIKEMYPKYLMAKMANKDVTIFDFDFELGETAKMLANQLIKDMALMDEVRKKIIELNDKRGNYKAKEFELGKRELLDKLKKQLKIKSYFQPIISSHVDFNDENKPVDFDIKGMECLMRWWYNESYVIPPLAIEIARQCGLEYEINSYLWENMLINVDRKKCKSFITFNISMNCLEKDSFMDDILGLFERYDMDPNGFVIEITEEDEFKNEKSALEKIIALKEKGFVFAIDDYGAGQTSMKYFSTNAFELVKIDGDLVKQAKENEQVYDIIGNIRELGKRSQKFANIRFKVLCEFIEDKDSFDRLAKLKVDYYQGYLFGKAVEFDEIVNNPMIANSGSIKHI